MLDVWVLPLSGERGPFPLLQTEFNEGHAQFSPDGRWLAYTSDESGRPEIYVQSFPAAGGKWRVSTHGGTHPRWRRSDGKELFYPDGRSNTLMAVMVNGDAHTFEAAVPVALFDVPVGRFRSGPFDGMYHYDVTADGQRFLVNTLVEAPPPPITIVLNWTAGLKR